MYDGISILYVYTTTVYDNSVTRERVDNNITEKVIIIMYGMCVHAYNIRYNNNKILLSAGR